MAEPITPKPSFDVPFAFKKCHLWAQRRVPDGYTDGEQRHWPGAPIYRPSAQEFYLCTLGQKWAEKDGVAQPGVQYYLDKLPDGYAMFETPQPGGPQVYRRLFGHPTGRFFDSALRFLPHFLWLMSGMDGDCECVHCGKKNKTLISRGPRTSREAIDKSIIGSQRHIRGLVDDDDDSNESSRASSMPPGIGEKRSQRKVRQLGATHTVDEEGTEDIYKDCVKKLGNARDGTRGVEIDLAEDSSIDWKADRQSLPQYLTRVEQQHSFVPRIGELVLWCPNFLDEHYLMLDQSTSEYKFYSFQQKCFHGFPDWRGGVVAAAPSASIKNGPIDFPDILDVPAKKTSFNTAGFRIETMPDPNDDMNKSMSKQYRYIPLRNIRPLAHWRLLLNGIPVEKRHSSVEYALTCMTSLSLLEKWKFNGDWPKARIFCKGMYLGSELITVGDTIRLLQSEIKGLLQPDVLVVESIRYNLREMQPEHARANNPRLSNESFITLIGSAYTIDKNKLSRLKTSTGLQAASHPPLKTSEVKTIFRSVGAEEYGLWYPWHGPHQKYEVSHEQILGRLFEADAVRLWNGQRQIKSTTENMTPSLDFDTNSILAGRRYATLTDARLAEPQSNTEINWFLADTRAEALALATVNGIDIARYHEVRTPPTLKQWRMQVKVADGQQITPEVDAYIRDLSQIQLHTGGRRGRPPGSKVVDGKLLLPGEYIATEGDTEAEEEKTKPSSQMAGAAMVSDTENTSEGDYSDDLDDDIQIIEPASKSQSASTSRKTAEPMATLSKAAIMASVEVPDDEIFDNDISDEETWWENLPPARGGTEESEGGDYRE